LQAFCAVSCEQIRVARSPRGSGEGRSDVTAAYDSAADARFVVTIEPETIRPIAMSA
jgi:hypothetical protein